MCGIYCDGGGVCVVYIVMVVVCVCGIYCDGGGVCVWYIL